MSEVDPLLAVISYRIITMMIGLAFAFMGYKLFDRAVYRTSDAEAVMGSARLILKRGAPGTVFAFFGAALIGVSLWKGFDVSKPTYGTRALSFASDGPTLSAETIDEIFKRTTDAEADRKLLKALAASSKLTPEERAAIEKLLRNAERIHAVAGEFKENQPKHPLAVPSAVG